MMMFAPAGFIVYVSDCYGGRVSDRFICLHNKFYFHARNRDEVIAEHGFPITEDLLYYHCELSVQGAILESLLTSTDASVQEKLQILRYMSIEL